MLTIKLNEADDIELDAMKNLNMEAQASECASQNIKTDLRLVSGEALNSEAGIPLELLLETNTPIEEKILNLQRIILQNSDVATVQDYDYTQDRINRRLHFSFNIKLKDGKNMTIEF